MAQEWTVGELAQRAGVSVRTLHHYDEIGLLRPTRSAAGHRRYTGPDVARLTQVVALRSVGLSLGEIQCCLDDGEALAATLIRQLRDLDLRVAQTTALRDRLATVVAQLESGRDLDINDLMALIGDTKMLAEGKTKIVEDAGNGEVLVHSKDDITAGDGARHDVLEGKAAASTRTTCNIFRLLERRGVRTHFVDLVDDVTFRARNVEMIPLELVARRYASGSVRDRFPDLSDGAVFEELVFEIFEKDDANHDPLLDFDFDAGVLRRYVPNKEAAAAIGPNVSAGDLITEEPLAESRYADVSPELFAGLRSCTVSAFEIIEDAWKQHGGVYIDFKIECGFDRETGDLLVADVIDSDSGRLRFGDVDMSKQSYRDGTATLPEIKKKFDEVAALTDRFV
ncbi:MAG TPA: phosphoribosylaminoimidazolesuccinocarboxamide synthase [Acidimicrobiales bacterium]|nr:phosphoribosylaminoimidazolesuccinocarboxamide synthase [Acidimicrobiales bacterium]